MRTIRPSPPAPHPPKIAFGVPRCIYTRFCTNDSTKSQTPQLIETPISIHQNIPKRDSNSSKLPTP